PYAHEQPARGRIDARGLHHRPHVPHADRAEDADDDQDDHRFDQGETASGTAVHGWAPSAAGTVSPGSHAAASSVEPGSRSFSSTASPTRRRPMLSTARVPLRCATSTLACTNRRSERSGAKPGSSSADGSSNPSSTALRREEKAASRSPRAV